MPTTPLRDLAPHVRLLAWPDLNATATVPGVSVHVPPELTGARQLAWHSAETTVTTTGDPAALLTDPAVAATLTEPVRLVRSLALFDDVVRAENVYQGNIYLASEASVAGLLDVAAGVPVDTARLATDLEQLHALELLYRFPVAYKFRGGHGIERQCRINGWGRLLDRLLTRAGLDTDWAEAVRARLTVHVRRHRPAYLDGVADALVADDRSDGTVWARIHRRQPIPVLI
ncbi:hypothetical protein [Actinoplanes sp. NPDC051494]|uniref:hypothetical protein n=1 Tax=Actinoplanes sp. NPDC051494 TaxID=3363907 RepID=UPI00379C8E6E